MSSSQLSELEVEAATLVFNPEDEIPVTLEWQSENEIMYLTEPLFESAEKAFKLVFKLDDQNERRLIAFKFPLYLKDMKHLSHINSILDRITSIINNQLPNTQPFPNRSTALLPGNQAKPVSFNEEQRPPPSYEASNHITPGNELTSNVSAKRCCVSQGPDGRPDVVSTMEDLQLENSELKQQQKAAHVDIMGLESDVAQHKAKALAMGNKLCELEKERKKNKDKIIEIEKDIEDIQADVSAMNEKDETDDANLLHARKDQQELVNRLDATHKNQE
ncbi:hypothetical protein FDENT_12670 [Fusarium denticulatum]|uniref:Uncharacterized protein n=1 Tax=Fusarium denticulatum TaxID=48507 RepID=A0A8H5T8J9_9HYPO|nr:hypothetical protein FDENT_12670 [Fusarium denticulatum]